MTVYGYRYDVQKNDFVKTSVLYISTFIDNNSTLATRIFLDGKMVGDVTPLRIMDVRPGKYELWVKKDGYKLWKKQVVIQKDYVTSIENVYLVPDNTKHHIQSLKNGVKDFAFNEKGDFMAISLHSGKLLLKNMQEEEENVLKIDGLENFFWRGNILVFHTKKGEMELDVNTQTIVKAGKHKTLPEEVVNVSGFVIQDDFEIWLKNASMKKKGIVMRLTSKIEEVISINNSKNFIYSTRQLVGICDSDGKNCYPLTLKDPLSSISFHMDKVYFVVKDVLYSLSLRQKVEKSSLNEVFT